MGEELNITDELLLSRILDLRGCKVMIDHDLAELYGVTTKRLNEQVKRNHKRFPPDFMFRLTEEERVRWSQNATTLPILSILTICHMYLLNMGQLCWQVCSTVKGQ